MPTAFTDKISTGGVISWGGTAIDRVTNFGIRISCAAVDVSAQDSGGNRKFIPGLREITFTASTVWDQNDAQHAVLQAAADAGTKATLAITPVVGAPVFSVEAAIESIGRPMNLGDAITADFAFFVSDASTISDVGL